MFGGDRYEPCSSPDFYCDGGCKPGFDKSRTFVTVLCYLWNPDVSLTNSAVMAVLTVLTGMMKLIVQNLNHKSVAVLYLLKKQKHWVLTYLILSLDIANGIFRRQKGIFSGQDHNSNYVKRHFILWYILSVSLLDTAFQKQLKQFKQGPRNLNS